MSPRASETAAELGQSSPVPEPAAVEPIPATVVEPTPAIMTPNGKQHDWPQMSRAVQERIMAAKSLEEIEAICAVDRDILNKMFKANQDAYRAIVNTVNACRATLTGADRS